jgi:hypothetical protein
LHLSGQAPLRQEMGRKDWRGLEICEICRA